MKSFKSLKFVLTTLILVFTFTLSVFAGTAVIQLTDKKAQPVTRGKVFSISCKVKSTDVRIKSADISAQYDPNMLEFVADGSNAEGGAGTIRMNGTGYGKSSGTKTLEFQLKFRALYAGTTTITILDQEVNDTTDNLVNVTKIGTSTIVIKPANTQSKNANLKTLEFSPGELDREFDSSVLAYNTEVNADVDSLVISAPTEDEDAKTTITGNENFQTGMNKVTIDVTAPDGKTTKQYVINVTKLENGVTSGTTVITNGQKFTSRPYTVTKMSVEDDSIIPYGYKRHTLVYGSESTEAFAPTNTPEGVTPEVYLIYGMNADGVTDFYRYDTRNGDDTIQRYVPEPNAGDYERIQNEYNNLKESSELTSKRFGIIFPVTIILAALVLILIIILIVMIVRGGSSKKPNEYDLEDDDDDDYFSSKPRRVTQTVEKDDYNDDLDDKYGLDNKKEDFSDTYDDNFNDSDNDNLDEDEIEDLG